MRTIYAVKAESQGQVWQVSHATLEQAQKQVRSLEQVFQTAKVTGFSVSLVKQVSA